MKHTSGPWKTSPAKHNICDTFGVKKESGSWIALCHPFEDKKIKREEAEANASRIVSCVNALEGFADPEAAKDLLEAAEDVIQQFDSRKSICPADLHDSINIFLRKAWLKAIPDPKAEGK